MNTMIKIRDSENQKCILYPKCPYLTAVCRVILPDNGCYVYRWFKQLILEDKVSDKNLI